MSLWDSVKKFTQPYADEDYDDLDDDDLYDQGRSTARPSAPTRPATSAPVEDSGFGNRVLNGGSNKPGVVLFRPMSFKDAVSAADELRQRKAIIVNLENLDKAVSRRVVDFLTGCAYALGGSVKKITDGTYLFCPHNMDVAGDLGGLNSQMDINF